MIDLTLSQRDQAILDEVRRQALVCREYARYYDDHEEEFAPDALSEADDFKSPWQVDVAPGPDDSPPGVLGMLVSAAMNWGDYTVRLRREIKRRGL